MAQGDGVIILHGIGRGARSMNAAERTFARAGFRCLNLDYAARTHDLAALAGQVADMAMPWIASLEGRFHFVTHSMGGLVARTFITRYRPANLGRVVMLGTPNGGSEIADLLAPTRVYQAIFGPAGGQLTTTATTKLAALLGPVDYPLGVIAGTCALDPLSWLLLPKPNDGKVSVERTKVVGMSDHLILPVTHTLMMLNPIVLRAALHFISFGSFPSPRDAAIPARRVSRDRR